MTPTTAAPREITRAEFQHVCAFLYDATGIRLVAGKEPMVMGRLEKRLRALGLTTYTEYFDLLRQPGQELELRHATDLLTTNETSFFREPAHFAFLRDVVLPAHPGGRPFRLWSAASSSGEEAYTAAMVIAEHLRGPFEIVGTDISSRVVETSQRGLYPIAASERIPPALLRKHCRKGRDEYDGMLAISAELRARTTFLCANLLGTLPSIGTFDVILLRNVMIYFDLPTKARLVQRLQHLLVPGGYFLISHSETLNGIPSSLRMVGPSVYRLEPTT